MGSWCPPQRGWTCREEAGRKGLRSAEGEGSRNPATRPAFPAAAWEDQGSRPRSHAAVEPAARPSWGPKARAGPAIFAFPSPGPARRLRRTGPPQAPAAFPVRPGVPPLYTPGVVGHVPYEERRVGGAQVAGHDGDVSLAGALTGSVNRPRIRRRILRHSQPEGSATKPPLLARLHSRLHPLLPGLNAGTRNGSFPRDHRACACAGGRRRYVPQPLSHSLASWAASSPSPKPALSFFSALFSRLFLPCTGFPLPPILRQEADVLTSTPNFTVIANQSFKH